MDGRLDTPDAVEAACWRELAAAVADRGHPWRTPVLATVDGDAADARTVVLREVDAAARRLRFFTDARAPKLAQLAAAPLGTLVMRSARLQWQLRLRVRLVRQTDPAVVAPRWQRLAGSPAAGDYLSAHPPGTPLDDAMPGHPLDAPQFAVVDAQVLRLDWLALSPAGHRRVVADEGGSRFVQP